jgi:hypothetical protein
MGKNVTVKPGGAIVVYGPDGKIVNNRPGPAPAPTDLSTLRPVPVPMPHGPSPAAFDPAAAAYRAFQHQNPRPRRPIVDGEPAAALRLARNKAFDLDRLAQSIEPDTGAALTEKQVADIELIMRSVTEADLQIREAEVGFGIRAVARALLKRTWPLAEQMEKDINVGYMMGDQEAVDRFTVAGNRMEQALGAVGRRTQAHLDVRAVAMSQELADTTAAVARMRTASSSHDTIEHRTKASAKMELNFTGLSLIPGLSHERVHSSGYATAYEQDNTHARTSHGKIGGVYDAGVNTSVLLAQQDVHNALSELTALQEKAGRRAGKSEWIEQAALRRSS